MNDIDRIVEGFDKLREAIQAGVINQRDTTAEISMALIDIGEQVCTDLNRIAQALENNSK